MWTSVLLRRSLAKLWAQLKDDWERFGYFYQTGDGSPAVLQSGVMRVNCIDCLDRTNVVQGLLGRKHLEATLTRAGLLPPGAALETAFPAVRLQLSCAATMARTAAVLTTHAGRAPLLPWSCSHFRFSMVIVRR